MYLITDPDLAQVGRYLFVQMRNLKSSDIFFDCDIRTRIPMTPSRVWNLAPIWVGVGVGALAPPLRRLALECRASSQAWSMSLDKLSPPHQGCPHWRSSANVFAQTVRETWQQQGKLVSNVYKFGFGVTSTLLVLSFRFAPHLEKCMGMGRNSSRIASRRLANSANKDKDHDHDGGEDEDEDWIEPSKAVGNRRKVRFYSYKFLVIQCIIKIYPLILQLYLAERQEFSPTKPWRWKLISCHELHFFCHELLQRKLDGHAFRSTDATTWIWKYDTRRGT